MYKNTSHRVRDARIHFVCIAGVLFSLLLSACSLGSWSSQSQTKTTTSIGGGQPGFPTSPLSLRTPKFGSEEKIASTVKILASAEPSLIIQFPLVPTSIKPLFPRAAGVVTVMQGNPAISVFDTVIIDVQNMPPNIKFSVFLTELAVKPFGHAEYIGDVFTRGDGTGESAFHLITFVAFAADARNSAVTSADQSGTASGIQLEHLGMWFDGISTAHDVLKNRTIASTPFDGGATPAHAGPQAMTDGQQLPVI